ncbi:hypothetical protein QVH35_00375 [Candidatus Nitrosotenuis chungbukensis]|uniref:hypothetical protein n=1 Tax=Candidatus Nitrosotenuis chungbukensis TaxID=1353246 RepID=UPI0026736AF9|nr:hypothetical protein [Candidatus Nitrosotenuis chungbukensis]WKT58035.1 hypothetical protein QVH35_00375 [Candidatus Nitrosotenuis chungbukensis]
MRNQKLTKLTHLGVRDSKKLTPSARAYLYKKITGLVDDYAISKATPKAIDDSVARHQLEPP